jgi:undecaprenyl-phosphate galactose phosphotransferase/putative colanic acid biosynthesis UDP-glucose lipid carrier transferase
MDSPGPVFFSGNDSGRDNKDFWCVKFRTMQVINFQTYRATLGDNRVTKMGAFMRRTNIDELPQFLFWGTMSVIGPRPHMLKHTEQYSELIKLSGTTLCQTRISGWAQVNGFRGGD